MVNFFETALRVGAGARDASKRRRTASLPKAAFQALRTRVALDMLVKLITPIRNACDERAKTAAKRFLVRRVVDGSGTFESFDVREGGLSAVVSFSAFSREVDENDVRFLTASGVDVREHLRTTETFELNPELLNDPEARDAINRCLSKLPKRFQDRGVLVRRSATVLDRGALDDVVALTQRDRRKIEALWQVMRPVISVRSPDLADSKPITLLQTARRLLSAGK